MLQRIEKFTIRKLTEYFTDEFIQRNSRFNSFDELWHAIDSPLKNKMTFFDFIKTEEWNNFIKNETDFINYREMEIASRFYDFKKIREEEC